MSPAGWEAPPEVGRVQRWALITGVVALLACLAGVRFDPTHFFRSYLFAYVFYCGLALGSLGILLLLLATGGAWGVVVRRPLEAAAGTLPLLLLLLLPLLLGLRVLYPWTDPAVVAESGVLQHKRAYLNVPLFVVRAGLYFALWIGMTSLLRRWSRAQDQSDDPALERRLRAWSAPGLVLFLPSVSFAYIDWIMSLEPEWSSSIFGLVIVAGQGLSALALVIVVIALLSRREPLRGVIMPRHVHNLGKLLLAFVMIWAYLSFAQWLLIWSGNLPEEITWYLHRVRGGWQWLGLGLILLHFALPFVLLLSRGLKRRASSLAAVAVLVLELRLAEQFWLTAPSFHPERFVIGWMDVLMPIGMGGIWLAYFARRLRRAPLLPANSPSLAEELEKAEGGPP